MKKFMVRKLEERIAPAILTTSVTGSKTTKHPGPTDTVTTTTVVESTNPAGHNPPGQPNYTTTTTTEVHNRLAR